ncbi:heat-inducible transcriptional repressor HrcA [Corynebacterium bovis]|uniref:heat-inducible transcriptional repressor HrcA n=1 Tax=Corynebacterium bovis TaxID=36808 RepID=UPI0031389025
MTGTAETRRGHVLRAIVTDYISSQEPVGSKALVERHGLGVSPATIRNDMAALEAEGYITQEHASSGRVPKQKGYRRFVDGMSGIKPMSAPERRAVLEFLSGGVDMEDVLRRSVQLLAQLTRQVAVVQLPDLRAGRVKHCEVVQLAPARLLLVLITDTGRVDQRNVDLTEPMPEADTPRLRDIINTALVGRTLDDASANVSALAAGEVAGLPADLRGPALACATVLVETMLERSSDRLILAGTPNLLNVNELQPVIEALEEQVVMLKLLSSVRDLGARAGGVAGGVAGEPGGPGPGVQVSIGGGNEDEELRAASVLATGYGSGGEVLGGLGVVGPTYIDYSGSMSSLSVVAHYVSRILSGR